MGKENVNKRYKRYEDYLYELQEKFPEFSYNDLSVIIKYGTDAMSTVLKKNADVLVLSKLEEFNFKMFIGRVTFQSIAHRVRYIVNKATIRFKLLYRRRKIKWDGYYYFGLSNKQFEKWQAQMSPWFKTDAVRRKRYKNTTFNYGDVFLYRIYDECRLNGQYIHFFRVPAMLKGFKVYMKQYKTKKAEYISRRSIDGYESMIMDDYKPKELSKY